MEELCEDIDISKHGKRIVLNRKYLILIHLNRKLIINCGWIAINSMRELFNIFFFLICVVSCLFNYCV